MLTAFVYNQTQVKIRGYRVEPGEIETVIGQHTDVRKAAVVVRVLPSQEKQLVAYFVPGSTVRVRWHMEFVRTACLLVVCISEGL